MRTNEVISLSVPSGTKNRISSLRAAYKGQPINFSKLLWPVLNEFITSLEKQFGVEPNESEGGSVEGVEEEPRVPQEPLQQHETNPAGVEDSAAAVDGCDDRSEEEGDKARDDNTDGVVAE